MRKSLVLVLLVLASLLLVSCKRDDDVIVVGLEADYAPFNWSTSVKTEFTHPLHGRVDYADGYDVQIAKLIAEGLGKKLVIKAVGWDGLIPAADSGSIDLIIAGMTPTPDRATSILFTEEYFRAEPVIILRKDSNFYNQEAVNAGTVSVNDFKGAKAVAQLGTIYEGLVDQLPGAVKETSLENYAMLELSLANKDADIVIAEQPVAEGMVNKNKDLIYISFTEGNGFEVETLDVIVSIGLKLGRNSLKDEIDEILKGISNEQRNALMAAAIARQ